MKWLCVCALFKCIFVNALSLSLPVLKWLEIPSQDSRPHLHCRIIYVKIVAFDSEFGWNVLRHRTLNLSLCLYHNSPRNNNGKNERENTCSSRDTHEISTVQFYNLYEWSSDMVCVKRKANSNPEINGKANGWKNACRTFFSLFNVLDHRHG